MLEKVVRFKRKSRFIMEEKLYLMEEKILSMIERLSEKYDRQTEKLDRHAERLEALEKGRVLSESPGKDEELHLNSVMFGNESGLPRRRSLLPTGEFRQQHVPNFKGNLSGELTMAKAFAFKMETEKYMRYNSDALLQPQLHVTDKVRDLMVGSSPVLTLDIYDTLTPEQFNKYLLQAVKPMTPTGFLVAMRELLNYQLEKVARVSNKYMSPEDWQKRYTATKLLCEATSKSYALLTDLVLGDKRCIPNSKPDPSCKGESLVEVFEEQMDLTYMQILKKRYSDKFHQSKSDFMRYVRLFQNTNEEVFDQVRPTLSLQQQMYEFNAKNREDERLVQTTKQNMSTYSKKSYVPKVQSVAGEEFESDALRKHPNAGGTQYDHDDVMRDILDAELNYDEVSHNEETQQQQEDSYLSMDDAFTSAVQAVRFAVDEKKKPYGILKADGLKPQPKEICWSLTFNGKCNRGDSCQNIHAEGPIVSKLQELLRVWTDRSTGK